MDKFKIINLPKLSFAHIFGADNYHRNFPAREGLLEITYISKGSLPCIRGGVRYDATEGDVTCDFFDLPQQFEADTPHEHHTVGFFMDFCPSNEGIYIPYLTKSTYALAPIRERIDEIIRRKTIAPEDDITLAGLFLTLLGELADYHKTR
ncbi:MAG: hypothetical protein E7632_08475, partial [Ruminococcaceae bacterium]|nr:hypothetical protein [Oscillospiraceae bacterium]